ncbi:MAG: DUF2784 domain-containing protein [Oligoflexales bacterium]|nr:DUF2784 domain-containing protein [Oligoflexales bacterium]
MPGQLLSDTLLVIHVLWVLFIVLMVPLVISGHFFRWRWIRSWKIRYLHLVMMLFVTVETWLGIQCPLTVWENVFRARRGAENYRDSFVGYWLQRIIYYDFKPWVFLAAYSFFLLVIAALIFLIPPEHRKNRKDGV